MAGAIGHISLFGGPAGAGKSTLAAAWCATSEGAVHIELDAIRSLIVSGLVDPQDTSSELQHQQYQASVRASCALAMSFAESGYDVAIDDVLEPTAFKDLWQLLLADAVYCVVILTPSLDETLRRAAARNKRVRPELIRAQHAASLSWPGEMRVDTTGLSVNESLALVRERGLVS